MRELGAPRSHASDIWTQFRRHPGAVIGAATFLIIATAVYIGPWLWPIEPDFINVRVRNQGMSWDHPFGTDHLGRDTFARVLSGGRVSISVGIAAMLLAIGIGTTVGLLAGYFRWLDGPLMRLTDLFLSLPILPLLLVIVTLFREALGRVFGLEIGIFLLVVTAIGITSWMQTARIVRGDVLALKEREFVLAARGVGTGDIRLVLRHILPNVISPVLVSAALGIANAIITESTLSFLGLGFPSDFATWGQLLSDGALYLADDPKRALWPGLAISLTVLSVTYMGDGLRDAIDARSRSHG